MEDKTQWLNGFLAEVVDGWMLKDLERLLNDIPHRPNEAGNCNFPIALYIFSCLDFLGHLTSTNLISSNQPGFTQARIMNFIDDFFPDDFRQKIQPHRNSFVNIFRNGLAHEYFAKSAGISRTETEPLQVNNQGMLTLDADRFAEAFRKSVERLKEAIKTDANLAERMADRYNSQYQHNLRFRITPTTTRISGASLAHPSMVRNLTTTTMPPPPKPKKS